MYKLLRLIVGGAMRIWFRKVYVGGRQNVPAGAPVILACNHPNTFLDGMVAAKFQPHKVYMLARGDVFKNNLIDRFLRFFYLLPIYRLKEGAGNLSKNEESFEECYKILNNNGSILIFSEGFSEQTWHLLPVKKGTARIAFGAEGFTGRPTGLKVVPVGINYTSFTQPGHVMMLNYAPPVDVGAYLPLYKENPAKAFNAFNKELEEKLKEVVLEMPQQLKKSSQNILLQILLNEFSGDGKWQENNNETFSRIKTGAEGLAKKLHSNENLKELKQMLNEYRKLLAIAGISDAAINGKSAYHAPVLFLLPVVAIGWLLHLIPLLASKWLPQLLIKDESFRPSAHFTLGMVLVPLYYLLLLVLIVSNGFWYMIALLPLMAFSGFMAIKFSYDLKNRWQLFKLRKWKKSHPKKFTKLRQLRTQILNFTVS